MRKRRNKYWHMRSVVRKTKFSLSATQYRESAKTLADMRDTLRPVFNDLYELWDKEQRGEPLISADPNVVKGTPLVRAIATQAYTEAHEKVTKSEQERGTAAQLLERLNEPEHDIQVRWKNENTLDVTVRPKGDT